MKPRARLTGLLLGTWLALAGSAGLAGDLQTLRARYEALAPQLASQRFHAPLAMESVGEPDHAQADVYGVIEQRFGTVRAELGNVANWCHVLMLHLNTKSCHVSAQGSRQLDVRIARRYDVSAADSPLLLFDYRTVASSPEYFDIQLRAGDGPFNTRDYRIELEAMVLDEVHTFVHLSYAFGYGTLGRMALQTFLATAGAGKVGFSAAPNTPSGLIDGVRGLVERNTMRYYLAIEAYLGSMSLPSDKRQEAQLQTWFTITEKYPRQLHEIDRATYIDMKRAELQALRAAP